MKQSIIELFITDDIKEQIDKNEILKGCQKCNFGIIVETDEICDCCLQKLLLLILNIPHRYNVEFQMTNFLKKQLKNIKPLTVLVGENKYVKLIGFYLGKEYVKNNKLVKYVSTSETIKPEDIVALQKADVVLFEDIYQKKSDITYKDYLIKRIDNNRQIVFLGETELIKTDDDFVKIEIDSSDIILKL